MLKKVVCSAGVVMLVIGATADAAHAGGFLKKLFGKSSECCGPAPEPECCCEPAPEPEPVCCCEPAPSPEPVCCEPAPVCCEAAPEPEPACCEPAPAPEPCCASTGGVMQGLVTTTPTIHYASPQVVYRAYPTTYATNRVVISSSSYAPTKASTVSTTQVMVPTSRVQTAPRYVSVR